MTFVTQAVGNVAIGSKAYRYLIEEIVEEGDLFITFTRLEKAHKCRFPQFIKAITPLVAAGRLGFYTFDGDDMVDLPPSDVPRRPAEAMQGVNFDPSPDTSLAYYLAILRDPPPS